MKVSIKGGLILCEPEPKTPKSRKKTGADLAVGDVLEFLGKYHTITHFETHPGLTMPSGIHFPARVACSGDWKITVFDDEEETVYNL